MKPTFLKSFFILVLATSCLVCTACSAAQPNTETQDLTVTSETMEETKTLDSVSDEPEDPYEEHELLDDIRLLVSYSDTGVITAADSCKATVIKSKADLDPYRKFLPDLTAELEKEILADTKGYCVLLEITSKGEYTYPNPVSVFQDGGIIELQISEIEEPEPQPSHTFFLYYISSEFYHGEEVRILFT